MSANNYFMEHYTDEIHLHGITRTLVGTRTKYQKIDIVDTLNYGRTLFLDDRVQSSERDSFIYHEALVHPPLLLHPNPARVMICGGGEGETLREILRHKSVRKAVMVDIDRQMVEFCRRELPEWSAGAFEDRRSATVYRDARAYLQKSREKFDIIIIDLTEPIEGGPSFKLYTKEFYALVRSRLSDHGMITLQAGTTRPHDTGLLTAIAKTIATAFPITRIYQVAIPSFGLPWGFIMGSLKIDPLTFSASEIDQLVARAGFKNLEYYDGITHLGMFAIPKYLRRDFDKQRRVITDKETMAVKFA